MSTWSFKDVAILGIGLPLLIYGIYVESGNDNRPENIKYVEDPRNGCKVDKIIQLANHQIHIRDNEYKAKRLYTYQCANGNFAANIQEE